MAKSYSKFTWYNKPSTSSPLSAQNLNHIEEGIDDLDDNQQGMMIDVEMELDSDDNPKNLVFTFFDGTTKKIDVSDMGGGKGITTLTITGNNALFYNKKVTVTVAGGQKIEATFDGTGKAIVPIAIIGTYTVESEGYTATITISQLKPASVEIKARTISISSTDSIFYNKTAVVTLPDLSTVNISLDATGAGIVYAKQVGTYKIACEGYETTVIIVTSDTTKTAVLNAYKLSITSNDSMFYNKTCVITKPSGATETITLNSTGAGSVYIYAVGNYSATCEGETITHDLTTLENFSMAFEKVWRGATIKINKGDFSAGDAISVTGTGFSESVNITSETSYEVHVSDVGTYTVKATGTGYYETTVTVTESSNLYEVNLSRGYVEVVFEKGTYTSIDYYKEIYTTFPDGTRKKTGTLSTGSSSEQTMYQAGSYISELIDTYDRTVEFEITEYDLINKRTIYVTFPKIPTVPFATASWSEISALLTKHYAGTADIRDYWGYDVRTEVMPSMSDGELSTGTLASKAVDLKIVSFNFETKSAGGKAAAVILVREYDQFKWNTVNGTEASVTWQNSPLRTWLNGTFYNALPSGLKSLVKEVTIKTRTGSGSYYNTSEKVYLPSIDNMRISWTSPGESTAMDIQIHKAPSIRSWTRTRAMDSTLYKVYAGVRTNYVPNNAYHAPATLSTNLGIAPLLNI